MSSSRKARPTWVRRWESTFPPTFGVSQKWLPRSLYSAQNTPFAFDHFLQPCHHCHRRFFLHQLRLINLAGGIVQNHDQVIPALVLKPSVQAALDVQQHAGQRPPWTPLAMHPALAPPRHQSCPLQGLLHPAVAEFDLMLIAEL